MKIWKKHKVVYRNFLILVINHTLEELIISKNFKYLFRHINIHYSVLSSHKYDVTTFCQWQPWHAALEIPNSQ